MRWEESTSFNGGPALLSGSDGMEGFSLPGLGSYKERPYRAEKVVTGPAAYAFAALFALAIGGVLLYAAWPYITGNFAMTSHIDVGDILTIRVKGQSDTVKVTSINRIGGQEILGFSFTTQQNISFTRSDVEHILTQTEREDLFRSPNTLRFSL